MSTEVMGVDRTGQRPVGGLKACVEEELPHPVTVPGENSRGLGVWLFAPRWHWLGQWCLQGGRDRKDGECVWGPVNTGSPRSPQEGLSQRCLDTTLEPGEGVGLE